MDPTELHAIASLEYTSIDKHSSSRKTNELQDSSIKLKSQATREALLQD